MQGACQLLHKKNQDGLIPIIRPFYQQVLNLMGATVETNPIVLTGHVMNEDEELLHATESFNAKVVFCSRPSRPLQTQLFFTAGCHRLLSLVRPAASSPFDPEHSLSAVEFS
jgi:hypothetical protein